MDVMRLKDPQIFDCLTYANTHRQLVMEKLCDNPGVTSKMKSDAKKAMFAYFRTKDILFGKSKNGQLPSDRQAELHWNDFLANTKKKVRICFENNISLLY